MKKGITMKDILEDDSIFRPKRRDLLKEDNIVFHTNSRDDDLIMTKSGQMENENPSVLDFERQKELEQYRKRFEEALVRIEDKEDVMAFHQARREIDDEFVEENVPTTPGGASTTQGGEDPTAAPTENNLEDQAPENEEQKAPQTAVAHELDNRNAQSL